MQNVNKIKVNADGSITVLDTTKNFASSEGQSYIKVLTTLPDTYAFYGVFGKHTEINGKTYFQDTQRLVMLPLGEETLDGVVYNAFSQIVPVQVLSRLVDDNYQQFGFQLQAYNVEDNDKYLGIEFYETSDTDEIIGHLEDDYPDAEEDDFVRVLDTDSDWVYDGTDWEDSETIRDWGIRKLNSSVELFDIEAAYEGETPSHKPENTELILEQLKKSFFRDGTKSATDDWDLAGHRLKNIGGITDLEEPTDGKDAANKKYVDDEVAGAEDYGDDAVAAHDEDQDAHKDMLNEKFKDVFKSVTMDNSTFVITFERYDGTTETIDLPSEETVVNIDFDEEEKDLIFTLRSGSTTRVPLDDLVEGLATDSNIESIEEDIENIETEMNTGVDVDNQDENRTDKLKFAIIDGHLAYEVEEGE